jgi:hypothetical protein
VDDEDEYFMEDEESVEVRDRVPGWLTGEEGRTEGRVRDGRIESV